MAHLLSHILFYQIATIQLILFLESGNNQQYLILVFCRDFFSIFNFAQNSLVHIQMKCNNAMAKIALFGKLWFELWLVGLANVCNVGWVYFFCGGKKKTK
jgi:hypothetical protein